MPNGRENLEDISVGRNGWFNWWADSFCPPGSMARWWLMMVEMSTRRAPLLFNQFNPVISLLNPTSTVTMPMTNTKTNANTNAKQDTDKEKDKVE